MAAKAEMDMGWIHSWVGSGWFTKLSAFGGSGWVGTLSKNAKNAVHSQ